MTMPHRPSRAHVGAVLALAGVVAAALAATLSMSLVTVNASSLGGITSQAVYAATMPAPPDTTPPFVPSVTATPGDGEVLVEWTGSTDTVSWALYMDGSPVQTFPGGTGSFLVTGLTNDVEYTFDVDATDRAGNTSAPGTATATPHSPE